MVLDNNTDWKARTGVVGDVSDFRVRSVLSSVQIGQYCKQADGAMGMSFGGLLLDPTVE